jgi:hypothetical protein
VRPLRHPCALHSGCCVHIGMRGSVFPAAALSQRSACALTTSSSAGLWRSGIERAGLGRGKPLLLVRPVGLFHVIANYVRSRPVGCAAHQGRTPCLTVRHLTSRHYAVRGRPNQHGSKGDSPRRETKSGARTSPNEAGQPNGTAKRCEIERAGHVIPGYPAKVIADALRRSVSTLSNARYVRRD